MAVRRNDVNRRDLKTLLRNIDFTDKQASVYVALLELGEATKTELARKANIKRPTLYLVLEQLEEKLAVTRRYDGPREFVRAVSPYALASQRDRVTNKFVQNIPELLSVAAHSSFAPKLLPILGPKDVVSSMNDRLNARTDLLFWADRNLQFSNHKMVLDHQIPYRKRRVERGIWTRGIIPYEPILRKIRDEHLLDSQRLYVELKQRQEQELRDFVFVPRNHSTQACEIWIFDDKVDFYAADTCIGARVQSEQFSQTLRGIFLVELERARSAEKRLINTRDSTLLASSKT
jgi:predicted transcriptional regulator